MVVIWGLDLREMKWSDFKSSYMFGNTEFHLRRTKFIIYQCAMILLVISESLGTAVLSDYTDQQSELQNRFPGVNVFNNDYVGVASFNIFVGVFSSIVFGAAFFFDLFFPNRYEPRWVQNMWMGGAIFSAVTGLGDALAYTVILTLHDEIITGGNLADPELTQAVQQAAGTTPVSYKNGGRAVASVVFLWVGWVCAVASTIVMVKFYRYYRQHDTAKSTHARNPQEKKFDTPESNEKSTNSVADPNLMRKQYTAEHFAPNTVSSNQREV